MEDIDMIVEFEKYCETCEYKDTKQHLDPCHECLGHPVNTNSVKPVMYKEKENDGSNKGK